MATSAITTDQEVIRKWVEGRGGKPAKVRGTGENENTGILRVLFPGQGSDNRLEEISWAGFFKNFEDNKIAFLYQEKTLAGEESRFFKFVGRK